MKSKKLKITHLFNPDRGSRYPLMISQGLINAPEIEPAFNAPVVSLGQVRAYHRPDIKRAIKEADYIFRAGEGHFGLPNLDKLIEPHWGKVVYYDFRDTTDLNEDWLGRCRLYLKRTWQGQKRDKMMVLPYGVLDEYIYPADNRDLDLVFLMRPKNRDTTVSRHRVYRILSRCGIHNSIIGNVTYTDGDGRRAILAGPDGNPFIKYLELLSRAKVVFTCQPDHPGGDSRIWEAFASGALVVTDNLPNIYPPPEDGKHCILYDPATEKDIWQAVRRVKVLLGRPDKRREIARAGRKWALDNHSSLSRIRQVLAKLGEV